MFRPTDKSVRDDKRDRDVIEAVNDVDTWKSCPEDVTTYKYVLCGGSSGNIQDNASDGGRYPLQRKDSDKVDQNYGDNGDDDIRVLERS